MVHLILVYREEEQLRDARERESAEREHNKVKGSEKLWKIVYIVVSYLKIPFSFYNSFVRTVKKNNTQTLTHNVYIHTDTHLYA